MKRKLSILTIILTLILPLFLSAYKVEAYNEEIGENNEIVSNSTEAENTSASETVTALADNDDNSTNGEEDTQSNEDWTDFSNAKFELKKKGVSGAIIEISGVTKNENHSYYLFITSNADKPSVSTTDTENNFFLGYDKNSNSFKTLDDDQVAKYVELNQDLYVTVLEKSGLNYNISTYGNKLTRYSEPKYNDAFHATFMTDDADQIITYFTNSGAYNRKIQIKVGKITDISILQKIKNQNSTGFEELLSYAKSNSGIYDQTVDADKNDRYALEYNAGEGETTGNKVIDINGLEDEEYYFLYVRTDDENGKYVSNEAVTLAQANVHNSNSWGMFFYGSSDFKWTDWETNSGGGKTDPGDDSVVPGTLPKTGYEYVAYGGIILVVAVSGFIAYKKYRKYNF